ncbi:MAG: Cys-tRNA(Pro) deacylase [Eubacteriales bacterium]|nr:Cys-tRNA(Pro) deacylase [Eubacteriales bacterium]
MEDKTNVMRVLDSRKIPYSHYCLQLNDAVSGVEMADRLGFPREKVFKTLVTVGKTKQHYVFMIPVAEELNLKKAARAASEKAIEMIKAKELLPLTGYVHGGCSPIGMKKPFPTYIHQTAATLETIVFSAGKVGFQVELPLAALQSVLPVEPVDLI